MQVRAAPGLRVPYEHDPRRHITDTESVTMPHTHYYVRRLAEGDLVEVPAEPVATNAAAPEVTAASDAIGAIARKR